MFWTKLKIWWLFNILSALNAIVIFIRSINNDLYNNDLAHFLYNASSVFIMVPIYIIFLINFLASTITGDRHEFISTYADINSGYSLWFFMCLMLLALGVNYIYARLLVSKSGQSLYQDIIVKHKIFSTIIFIIILIMFAMG